MKILKSENWIRIMSNNFSEKGGENFGKWMFFTEDRKFAEKMCKLAIKEKVCEFTKYRPKISEALSEKMLSIYKKAPTDSVVCFYSDANDFDTHKKILSFFKKHKILYKTSKNIYANISFKLDVQTLSGQFSGNKNFVPLLQLSDFMDLKTGKTKKIYTVDDKLSMIIGMLKSISKPNILVINPTTGECKTANPFYAFERYCYFYEMNLSTSSNLICLLNDKSDLICKSKNVLDFLYKNTWDIKRNRTFVFCDGSKLLKDIYTFLQNDGYEVSLRTNEWGFPTLMRKKYCCFAKDGVLVGLSFWYRGILFQFFNRDLFNTKFPKFNLLLNSIFKK